MVILVYFVFFFFNDTATTEIYTLSLHDALPILDGDPYAVELLDSPIAPPTGAVVETTVTVGVLLQDEEQDEVVERDRKSTRLNSSHSQISYAVFCLKKKKHRAHHVSSSLLSPAT